MARGRHEHLGTETGHGVRYPCLSIQRGLLAVDNVSFCSSSACIFSFSLISSTKIKLALLQIAREQKIAEL